MGWSVGYDDNWQRWIGYGVPAVCDQPGCGESIDRGLGRVCGGDVYGGDVGCGLFFCGHHLAHSTDDDECGVRCERCWLPGAELFEPTPDTVDWVEHMLTDESWLDWRAANPGEVAVMRQKVSA